MPRSTNLSNTGMRSGASGLRPPITSSSSVAMRVLPSYHGHFSLEMGSNTFAPVSAEMGTQLTCFATL